MNNLTLCESCEFVDRSEIVQGLSRCLNAAAIVQGAADYMDSGRFYHPLAFDPAGLVSCNGYKRKVITAKKAEQQKPLGRVCKHKTE